MIYKASLDKTAVIITNIVTLLFGALIVFNFILPLAIILLLTYLICLLLKPLSYEITEDELIIRRLLKSVHINRSDIESLKLIDKSAISGSIRTFGVGGLFGWFGKFANTQLGNMTWYVTRRDKPILIIKKDSKKILISPDEAEAFVAEFKGFKPIS
ncbi:PH domain-containing protein [Daejeonella rubra]|uniref:PH domain-containing protein n=1 Tax=Daejeonella rubra TaxID=990371 RepID=A0A1G9R5A5_9SPHI|nr:PH domain-containing protein [Daejeonella rubra]SDM18424.1 PH domain-containing protein [Daejeonella rubra]